jgi:hypothetical protein
MADEEKLAFEFGDRKAAVISRKKKGAANKATACCSANTGTTRASLDVPETLRAPVGPGALCPSIEVCRLRCAWTLSDPGFYFMREPGDSASSKPYPRGE